jgi:hypothetical protein
MMLASLRVRPVTAMFVAGHEKNSLPYAAVNRL